MPPARIVSSTMLGTFLEYFDYTLYGFSAPLIAHLFFPAQDATSALLMAWGVFAISFIVRPFGALLMGHLGDRWGRSRILTICISLMAVPTCAIGLLPTFQSVGIWAPIALIVCRLLQGMAISGEFAGSSVYLYESSVAYKGFFSSLTTAASGIGMLAASLWIFLFNYWHLSTFLVEANYWRLPFILAGLLIGLIGYYLRQNLPETTEFTAAQKTILSSPFLNLFKEQPGFFLISILLAGYTSFMTYTLLMYMATYLQANLHYSLTMALLVTAIIGLIESTMAPFCAWLSDRYGRLRIMMAGTIGVATSAVFLFEWLQTGDFLQQLLALTILAILLAAFDGPMMAYVLDQFGVNQRYSALGVSYNLGVGILGGAAPLILTWLIKVTHNALMPGIFMSALASLIILTLSIYHWVQNKPPVHRRHSKLNWLES